MRHATRAMGAKSCLAAAKICLKSQVVAFVVFVVVVAAVARNSLVFITALIFAAAVSASAVAFVAAFLHMCHNHHFAFLTFVASCNYKFINNATRLYIAACLLLCFLLAVSRNLLPLFSTLLCILFLSLLLLLLL